jgi:hypothetical protein
MNKKNITLTIASAIIASGLAMSVLGTNAPVFAQALTQDPGSNVDQSIEQGAGQAAVVGGGSNVSQSIRQAAEQFAQAGEGSNVDQSIEQFASQFANATG